MGETTKPLEENNSKAAPDGGGQQSLVLKTSLIKTLRELQSPYPEGDPTRGLVDSLISDVQRETNETLLYHKIKILNELLQGELQETQR